MSGVARALGFSPNSEGSCASKSAQAIAMLSTESPCGVAALSAVARVLQSTEV